MFYRQILKSGIEAALMLASVMGFGRFAYTALYPYMVAENIISVEQGSLAASANYIGYLLGALGAVKINKNQAGKVALFALVGTALCLLAMYFSQSGFGIIFIRFIAGVLSALGIVSVSMWLLVQCKRPQAVPIMYSGVGLGIALSAEGVVWGSNQAWLSPELWLMLAFVAGIIILGVAHGLLFERHQALNLSNSSNGLTSKLTANSLILLYGLAGFGYIITATYLPLLLKITLPETNIGHIWAIFGLSAIPACFIWHAVNLRFGSRLALVANLSLQAIGVAFPLILPNVWGYLFSALLVGGTFMGTVTLVMPIAQQLSKSGGRNLIAIVTVSYSIGQIIGSLVSGKIYHWTQQFHLTLFLATAALLVGAVIAWKNN